MSADTARSQTREVTRALDQPSLLKVRGLVKAFPGIVAVDNVDLDIGAGEIVALLGQNGAGKSTLIQVLSGVHPTGTYSGEVHISHTLLNASSVSNAEAAGIVFLAQELNTAPDMSVAQCLAIGHEPTRFGFVDSLRCLADATSTLKAFGLEVDPRKTMGELDLATQQLVLIARALSKNARLLILDEPTAALTEREAKRLFERMRELQKRGVSIVFVSHRLGEVFEISDRIVIMRDGKMSGNFITKATNREAVVDAMIGHKISDSLRSAPAAIGNMAIEAKSLVVTDFMGRTVVDHFDIAIRQGEIVGLFGLLGSGFVEVGMALFGAWRGDVEGQIFVGDRQVRLKSPSDAVALGIGLIAQDRRDGLSGMHSIFENAILADLPALSAKFGFVDNLFARRKVAEISKRLNIKSRSVLTLVEALSGGNQQKVQIARWLATGAKIMILIDPTRGVDVGARAEIKRIWKELAASGTAILLVSSDAEELVETADRVVVLRNGKAVGELAQVALTETALLNQATGV